MSTLPQGLLGRTGWDLSKLGYGATEAHGSRIWGGRPVADAATFAVRIVGHR